MAHDFAVTFVPISARLDPRALMVDFLVASLHRPVGSYQHFYEERPVVVLLPSAMEVAAHVDFPSLVFLFFLIRRFSG